MNNIKKIINNLYYFYRIFITSEFKERLEAPHIEKLSKELMKMYRGDYRRLCVSMPPRHSKSSIVTLAYPLWLIFNDPSLNILIINNTGDLSEKFGILIREHIRKYGDLFGLRLSDVKHSSTHIMLDDENGILQQGSIRLTGAGGSITGQDADYIIIDDPYKGFDDVTPSQLYKKILWFNTIVEQRIEPHTRLIILHTRWHSNDLQGYFKEYEPDHYKFLSFSAIQDGKPLWPQRYTLQELLDKQESMGERLFSSIYMQNPLDLTSDFFNLSHLTFGRPKNMRFITQCRAWDIASSTDIGEADYTAGVKMVKSGDNAVITDLVHGRFGPTTWKKIQHKAKTDTPNTHVVIETGVAASGDFLYDEWQKQLQGYVVARANVSSGQSKTDRATPLQNAIEDSKVYVDIHDDILRDRFIKEFESFPYGDHDDIVDATAHAYNYLFKNISPTKIYVGTRIGG